jgi:hypothetical protein
VPTAIRLEGEAYFHQCDSNRSGTLDLYETVSLLQNAGFPGTSGQYEQFFEQVTGPAGFERLLARRISSFIAIP